MTETEIMTEAEIMKSLEFSADCFYKNEVLTYKGMPIEMFSKAVLALLNRKNAEIEGLIMEIDELIIAKDQLFDEAEALIKKARAKAIEEVFTKVKSSSNKIDLICSGALVRREYTITEEKLDQIAKEMGVEL